MAPRKIPENKFREVMYDGEECIVFQTIGVNVYDVIVDKKMWYDLLKNYSWTALKSGNRVTVKTSINNTSITIWKVIIQNTKSELDIWGTTIDHINNNPLDNRLSNLRIYNSAILNSANVASKYKNDDMQYIQPQKSSGRINGYKVHYNVGGKVYYKHFGIREYKTETAALEAAKKYRDEECVKSKEAIIQSMIKKTRDIEFERGLRDKINAGEITEVIDILKKYGIEANEKELHIS